MVVVILYALVAFAVGIIAPESVLRQSQPLRVNEAVRIWGIGASIVSAWRSDLDEQFDAKLSAALVAFNGEAVDVGDVFFGEVRGHPGSRRSGWRNV